MTLTPNLHDRQILAGLTCAILVILCCYQAWTVEPVHVKYNGTTPSEYEVKAIYLYNFLKFVKWPEDACQDHTAGAHRIAVLGTSPFNKVLAALQKKLSLQGKDLDIVFLESYSQDTQLPDCCLLFIAESEHKDIPGILNRINGKSVLTVADSDSFIEQGGMISLVSHNNKIRWAVNRYPVKKSGLQLSSRLLNIAVKVIDEKTLHQD
jgi:hypothetical protein